MKLLGVRLLLNNRQVEVKNMNPVVANILLALIIVVFAYLVGGIPNAVIVGKLFYKKNPLNFGSHNSGGTNAGRVLGAKAGVTVIVLDIIKTAFVFWMCFLMVFLWPFEDLPLWLSGNVYIWMSLIFASIGHCYSPYLKGKGGKAVACMYGSVGGTSWVLFPLCFLIFGIVFKLCKKVMSKASIITGGILISLEWIIAIIAFYLGASFNSSFLTWTFGTVSLPLFGFESAIATTLVYLVLVLRHRDNIVRLKKGEEKPLKWEK